MLFTAVLIMCMGYSQASSDSLWLNTTLHTYFSKPRHHVTGADDKLKALNFITTEFEQYGLVVERHRFNTTVENVTGVNVIGVLKGENFGKEIDVLCAIAAHYDTMRNTPGVDDNGAGVVAMLEAAKILATTPRENTVLFFAFDFEEWETPDETDVACGAISCGATVLINDWLPGFLVESYGEETNDRGLPRILGTIVMDTVMNFDEEPAAQSIPPGFDQIFPYVNKRVQSDGEKGDFIALIGRADESTLSNLFSIVWHQAGGSEYELEAMKLPIRDEITQEDEELFSQFTRSDHISFWRKGLNAIFLTDTANLRGYMKTCYHGPCDDLSVVTDEKLGFLSKITDALVSIVDRISPEVSRIGAVSKGEKEVDANDEEPDITGTGIGIGLGAGVVLGAGGGLVVVYVYQRVRKKEATELNTIAVDEPNNYDNLGASRENDNMHERIGAHEDGTKASCSHENEEASRQNRTNDERS